MGIARLSRRSFAPALDSALAADITAAIDDLKAGAGTALDTLDELGAALGDDANFAATMTTALGNRVRFDAAQSMTDAQKAMARQNAGVGVLQQENRIINGAFDFWQRGVSSSSVGYVAADRWRNEFNGGTGAMSRVAFAVGEMLGKNSPTHFLREAVSGQSLTSHYAIVTQRIENVAAYAGQTITVLGWARRSAGAGNMAVSIDQRMGTGGSPSAIVVNAGQAIALSGSWAPFAVTLAVPSISGKTLGTNGDSATEVLFWLSAGSAFNARSGSIGVQTITVDLWGIHIRVGTHTVAACADYIAPAPVDELRRCQRYYEKSYNVGTNPGTVTNEGRNEWFGGGPNSYHKLCIPFLVEKRTQPGIAIYSPATGTPVRIRNDSSAADVAAGWQAIGTKSIVAVVSNVLLDGVFLSCHWVADAEL